MKAFKTFFSQLFTMMLFVFSLTVVFTLLEHKDAWKIIVTYWIILTVKNGFDYIFGWFSNQE